MSGMREDLCQTWNDLFSYCTTGQKDTQVQPCAGLRVLLSFRRNYDDIYNEFM